MAFTYKELLENIADAEERLEDAMTEYEYEIALNELEELYNQRDEYDANSMGEDYDVLDGLRGRGF